MIHVVKREAWGAAPPKSVAKMHPTRRDRIFGHWPAMPGVLSDIQMLQSAQRYHQVTKGWVDIAYSVAIGRDGLLYECRGPNVRGGHTAGENDDSYGVLFLCGTDELPTPEMLSAFSLAIEWLKQGDPLLPDSPRVMGHRHDDEASTACPGDELSDFLWNYNHKRDYLELMSADKEKLMQEYTKVVTRFYNTVLDRGPDQGGLDFWVDQLESGELSEVEVLAEFLKVRLAQDRAALKALVSKVDNNPTGGATAEVIVEQVYRRFLEELTALQE